ncbi:hypothetical protein EDB85DRAFT_2141179 [Lactarius pseudohatsudake]|nr:hypothetical protein EDB85DRAFT_2141179 [Lactarius pseudohatsudake]
MCSLIASAGVFVALSHPSPRPGVPIFKIFKLLKTFPSTFLVRWSNLDVPSGRFGSASPASMWIRNTDFWAGGLILDSYSVPPPPPSL